MAAMAKLFVPVAKTVLYVKLATGRGGALEWGLRAGEGLIRSRKHKCRKIADDHVCAMCCMHCMHRGLATRKLSVRLSVCPSVRL